MALVKYNLNGRTVEYDGNEFEIVTNCYTKKKYLHYIGDEKNATNPKGNTSCYCMFQDYKGTSLDLSKFDTNNVTDMSFMFSDCINLKTLNISNFNTNNVSAMNCMFMGCKNLKELDISSFFINDTKILDNMFLDCKSLETLQVSSDYLQFFSINRGLLKIENNVNIIPVSKLDKVVNDLFY